MNNKLIVYPLKTNFKFFIKISPKQLFIQYNTRILNYICKNKNNIDYNNYVTELKYNSSQIINFIKNTI